MNSIIPEAHTYLVDLDYQILISGLCILLLGTLILLRTLGFRLALFVVSIKILISIIYFTQFASGEWYIGGDDYGYFFRGAELYLQENRLTKIWTHKSMIYYLTEQHSIALPIILNYLAVALFGMYYHSVVFVNILLTCISAVFVAGILRTFCKEKAYVIFGTVFFAIHWTTVTWSSFMNLKEPLVTLLLLSAIYFLLNKKLGIVIQLVGVLVACYLLTFVRFYYPVFIIGGLLLASVNNVGRKGLLLGMTSVIVFVAGVMDDEVRFFFQFANIPGAPYELVHFILQPAPWKVTDPASYLLLPSILHWLMLFASVGGGIMLFRSGWVGRVVVFVLLLGLLFYGLIPMIASTRHRAPLDALIVLLQFHYLYQIFFASRSSGSAQLIKN